MHILVNGEPKEVAGEGVSVRELLLRLGFNHDFLAVAVNRVCVPRGKHAEHSLREADEVEILAPMAGG